ncbi:MAG TPA: AAA family ATPase [Phycisphaerae bacterium]|nr:AAA family ATPase [Phycisphaerae bacterium]
MNLRDVAISYQRAGLAVLPARRAEKRPAVGGWRQYRDRLPTEAEIQAWFANDHEALCILCGRISGHYEIIDFDAGGEKFSAWQEQIPPELRDRLVVERTPSGGYHVGYRCEAEICGNLKLAQRRLDDGKVVTLIETRGEGGLFLCSPTPGYEVVQGSLCDPPVLTGAERDVLLQTAWELNEYVPPVVDCPTHSAIVDQRGGMSVEPCGSRPENADRPGDVFNARGDVRTVLEQHGWVRVKGGVNEYWRRPGKATGWSATLKDGVFYVFSANAGPFEPNRAYSPFAVYTLLEHGGDWSRAASALRAQGYGSPPSLMSMSSPATSPLVDAAPIKLEPLTVRRLIATFPELRKPVIHGLLRQGETMNLISAPKMGKSWLVTDLALSIATGRDWLGQFRCERGDVLILDNELHQETSANRIPKVANARGIPIDAYADRVWVQNMRGCLQDVFSLGSYFHSLTPGRFKVIILDAFYRFMPRDMDENDNGTMASLYNHIDRYADLLGCCFVLIHHTTKGNQSGKSITDVGAGAGSQSRATDTHMILRAHEEDDAVVLDAAVRSWPPVAPRCLRWSFPVWMAADDLDPAQLRSDGGKKRGEKRPEWTVETFVEAFVGDRPATRSAILDKAVQAGLSHWLADRLLRSADADGLVIRQGQGKRNEPFTYQRRTSSSGEGEQ